MACEKVLIDYDLFARYKGYEKKYHSLKLEIEQLQSAHEDLEKKYNDHKAKTSLQTGSGIEPNSELETRLMTQENGIINDKTQKITPIDTAVQESAKVVPPSFETGVGNNNEQKKWYFIDVPKNVKL